jgi:hypothetical protein
MSVLAWPNKAVRRYESLWCLTQRFLWLNRPAHSDLVKTLNVPKNSIFSSLSLISSEAAAQRLKQETLRRLLRLSDLQWRRATLDTREVASQTCLVMRFCRICLSDAYHTALFQLLTITHCPVHGSELIRGCPDCGTEVPTTLEQCFFQAPFACQHCQKAFAEAAAIISPPSLGPLPEIGKIAEWYRWIAELPRVESRPVPNAQTESPWIDASVLALLERAGGKQAPHAVQLKREALVDGAIVVARYGTRPDEDDEWRGDLDRAERIALFYKAYRRHLQKKMRGVQAHMRAYVHRLDSSLEIPVSRDSQEVKSVAFALLLFRYTMEGWNDLRPFYHLMHASVGTAPHAFQVSEAAAGARLEWVGHMCSRAQTRWLRDHFFVEAMRGVFDEGLARARVMVSTGKYFLENLSQPTHDTQPCSLGIFDRKGRLEFWSLRGIGAGRCGRPSEMDESIEAVKWEREAGD